MTSFSKLFDGLTICQLVCASCFLLSSLFIASNPYAGFLAVFTGLLFLAHTGGVWYCIRQQQQQHSVSRTLYGAVLGSSCVMVVICLETAIFFGQYSACEKRNNSDDYIHGNTGQLGVSCRGRPAMTSLCTFAVFLFLLALCSVGALLRHKDDLLGEDCSLDHDMHHDLDREYCGDRDDDYGHGAGDDGAGSLLRQKRIPPSPSSSSSQLQKVCPPPRLLDEHSRSSSFSTDL